MVTHETLRSAGGRDSVIGRCEAGERVSGLDIRPVLLRRAAHLPERDRTLLRAVLDGRQSFRELSALVGVSAGQLCRRVKGIVGRLRDPVVVALVDLGGEGALSETQRRIGLQRFLLNRSARAIAREMELPYGQVVAAIGYVEGWAKGVRRAGGMRAEEMDEG